MPEVLITRAEASARTALSLVSIDKLVGEGKLPSVKIGHARRIPADAVDAFIAEAGAATQKRAAQATERKIAEMLAQRPPLGPEQRARLRQLLAQPVKVGASPGDAA